MIRKVKKDRTHTKNETKVSKLSPKVSQSFISRNFGISSLSSSQSVPVTLWSRYQDGGERVEITPGGLTERGGRKRQGWIFSVEDAAGGMRRDYSSAKGLLIDITRHPSARHWTLDRYFGIGKYEAKSDLSLSILDILDPSNVLSLRPQASQLLIDPVVFLPAEKPVLGIDLAKRGGEVAKLLFAGFGHVIHACGYDSEEVLQEVYAGILVRNRGTCAFDPSKASFGHYVHMVAECVLSNYHRKQNRIRSREQTGAMGYSDGEMVDVQDSSAADRESLSMYSREGSPLDRHMFSDLYKYIERSPCVTSVDAQVALKALPLVQEGYRRSEISESLGISKAAVSRALTFLRHTVKDWMDSSCPAH